MHFLKMHGNSSVQSKVMIHFYWSDSIMQRRQNLLYCSMSGGLFLDPIEIYLMVKNIQSGVFTSPLEGMCYGSN